MQRQKTQNLLKNGKSKLILLFMLYLGQFFFLIGINENHIELSKHIDSYFQGIPRSFRINVKELNFSKLKIIDLYLFQLVSKLYAVIISSCVFLKVVMNHSFYLHLIFMYWCYTKIGVRISFFFQLICSELCSDMKFCIFAMETVAI